MCASNSTLFDPNKKIPFKKAPLLMLALRWTPNFFGSIACRGRYLAGCEIWSNIFCQTNSFLGYCIPHSSEIRNFWFDFHIVKNGKFWSVFFDNFIKHKPLISEEGWCTYVMWNISLQTIFFDKKKCKRKKPKWKGNWNLCKIFVFLQKKCTNNQ